MTRGSPDLRAVRHRTKLVRDQQFLDPVQQAIDRDRMVRQQRAGLTKLQRCDESLTQRQRDVMTLVVTGLLKRQITAQLPTSGARSLLTEGS